MGSDTWDGHGTGWGQARKGGTELKAEPWVWQTGIRLGWKWGSGGYQKNKTGCISFPKEEQWGVKSRAGFVETPLASPTVKWHRWEEANGITGQEGSLAPRHVGTKWRIGKHLSAPAGLSEAGFSELAEQVTVVLVLGPQQTDLPEAGREEQVGMCGKAVWRLSTGRLVLQRAGSETWAALRSPVGCGTSGGLCACS